MRLSTLPSRGLRHMSENMINKSRYLLSVASTASVILCLVAIIAFNEYRMREYVGRPWQAERPDVLATLEDIQLRAEQGVRERGILVEKLQAIDDRVQQFERRMVIILRDEREQTLEPRRNGSPPQLK